MENIEYYYDIAGGNWKAKEVVEQIEQVAKREYNIITKRIDEAKAAEMLNMFIRSLRN
jgi:hypothetical protein